LTDATPIVSDEFVRKVKELLERVTGQPYGIAQKIRFHESTVWSVYLDEEKFNIEESLSLNEGARWVAQDVKGNICVTSWHFYDVDEVVSNEYGLDLQIYDKLLKRSNWEKYRKKAPGLIAELETAQKIVEDMNQKYGANIKLWAEQKPFLETCFNAKGLSEDEKLQKIERHARAMFETWGAWREWATKVGMEIYAKTTKMRLGWNEYVTKVLSHLRDFTGAKYVLKNKGKTALVAELDQSGANIFSNRGVGSFRETKGRIVMMSDIIGAIYARSMEEYWRIQKRWGTKVARVITDQGAEEPYNGVVISPEILEEVVKQVEERFDVKIKIRKDRPVFVTSFNTDKLRPYGKLYEIERHTRALAEAWSRIKEKVPNWR